MYKYFVQINKDVYDKNFDIEDLKQNLKNELEKKFGIQFGISTTWLNCGTPIRNPLEKVLFFKKILQDKSIMLDDTPYQDLYPMNG